MEKLRTARIALLLSVLLLGSLLPGAAHSLERAPGTPSVIVLDGRTEPPASVRSTKSESRSGRVRSAMWIVTVAGIQVLVAPRQVLVLRSSR